MKQLTLRRTTFGIVALTVATASGCGSTKKFANLPRPSTPVNLTVYINDSRVSVSPATGIGAGQVVFIVTNQATTAQSLTIRPAGSGSQSLASTGPINPEATDQVKVNLSRGRYTVATTGGGSSQAQAATTPPIRPAQLLVGRHRPTSNNVLLQP